MAHCVARAARFPRPLRSQVACSRPIPLTRAVVGSARGPRSRAPHEVCAAARVAKQSDSSRRERDRVLAELSATTPLPDALTLTHGRQRHEPARGEQVRVDVAHRRRESQALRRDGARGIVLNRAWIEAGLLEPFAEDRGLAELFATSAQSIEAEPRQFMMRFESAEHWLAIFRQWFGPMHMAFARLDAAGQAALTRDMLELVSSFDTSGGRALVAPSEYLEVVITRK